MRLQPQKRQTMQRQLYEQLRLAIVSGRLPKGMRLPASRTLARDLHVSRNTVLSAYEDLAADGWLSGRIGSGTRTARHVNVAWVTDPDGLTLNYLAPEATS